METLQPSPDSLSVGGMVEMLPIAPYTVLSGQRGVVLKFSDDKCDIRLDSGLELSSVSIHGVKKCNAGSDMTSPVQQFYAPMAGSADTTKAQLQAGRLKESLVRASAMQSTMPAWASLFWQSVKNECDLYGLDETVKKLLECHGYFGHGTTGPPRTDELKKGLQEIETLGVPAHGASLQNGGTLGQAGDPEHLQWHLRLPADLQRAAPELYRNIRAEGVASVRQWVNEQHPTLEQKQSPTYQDLFTTATIIDYELADCRSESSIMHKLATSDMLEIQLRKLGSFVYLRRTKDRAGAQRMLGVRAPGANADTAPKWMLDDANAFSKVEFQRVERGQKQNRHDGGSFVFRRWHKVCRKISWTWQRFWWWKGRWEEDRRWWGWQSHPRVRYGEELHSSTLPAGGEWGNYATAGAEMPHSWCVSARIHWWRPLVPFSFCPVQKDHNGRDSGHADCVGDRSVDFKCGGQRILWPRFWTNWTLETSPTSWLRLEPPLNAKWRWRLPGFWQGGAFLGLLRSLPGNAGGYTWQASNFSPIASLLKMPLDEWGYIKNDKVKQVPMIADRMVEPNTTKCIDMIAALPEDDAIYYQHEVNVVETNGKSDVLFKEIEEHYGFIGGTKQEYLRYLHRADVQQLWSWEPAEDVKAIAGISTVLKKDGYKQRKLIMQCAANYAFQDPTERANLGMAGGSALTRCHIPSDRMSVSACDEDAAFTMVRVPEWMRLWQAGPPVLAHQVFDLLPTSLQERFINRPHAMFPHAMLDWLWEARIVSTSWCVSIAAYRKNFVCTCESHAVRERPS